MRAALLATFVDSWTSVVKEVTKQTLKYGGRKALSYITTLVCGYFGSASIILITKSTKVVKYAKTCHSICFDGFNIAELCASAPINMLEIAIFEKPVMIESDGFDSFSKNSDPINNIEKLFKK